MLVAALVVLVVVLTIGIARLGDAVLRRARAQAVADVVALAAATRGTDAASEVAARNRAVVVAVAGGSGAPVAVTVRLGGATARAAATLD